MDSRPGPDREVPCLRSKGYRGERVIPYGVGPMPAAKFVRVLKAKCPLDGLRPRGRHQFNANQEFKGH